MSRITDTIQALKSMCEQHPHMMREEIMITLRDLQGEEIKHFCSTNGDYDIQLPSNVFPAYHGVIRTPYGKIWVQSKSKIFDNEK